MEKKQITLILGSILGLFAFLTVAYLLTSKPEVSSFPAVATASESDHVKWAPESDIVLMEFSDFQCPGCAAFASAIQGLHADEQFVKEGESRITFVYRHFPLDDIHPNARVAAQAAEAAGLQDAFYPMHDMLFARQDEWSGEDDPMPFFIEYATALELDIDTFTEAYNSQVVKDSIAEDYQTGIAAQVRGTPSLFLNGSVFSPPASPEEFKNALIEAIQTASSGQNE